MIPRLFILDDDLSFAKLLAVNLGPPSRYRTRVFDSADELFASCEEELPDAVITDMIMPGLDGVQVTRRLRTLYAHLPVFVLTGHADRSRGWLIERAEEIQERAFARAGRTDDERA